MVNDCPGLICLLVLLISTLNLDMLQNWLAPKLENLGIKDNGHAHGVRYYLSELYRERWFGRLSSVLLTPLNWSPRNPDLSPCENSLWGFDKEDSSATRPLKTLSS